MALKSVGKSTPGQRHQIRVNRNRAILQGSDEILAQYGPKLIKLRRGLNKVSGHNNQGRITVQGKGGGNKHSYRIIDWTRLLGDIPAIVKRIEYDPNRSAFLMLLVYNTGEISYQLAIEGVKVGQTIVNGSSAPNSIGNSKEVGEIPIGTRICLIETEPRMGAKLCRGAGTSALLVKKDWNISSKLYGYALIQLESGIFKHISTKCMATIGIISNLEHKNEVLGKAGVSRWKGRRPTVRGVAKNPVDHPHGGNTSGGRPSVTPYGLPTKGFKTRHTPSNFRHLTIRP